MGVVIGSGSTNKFQTVMALVKPFVGAGVLSMPAVWSLGGVAASNTLLLILAYVAGWCIFRLVDCCDVVMLCEARRNMHIRIYRKRHNIASAEDVPADYFDTMDGVTDADLIAEDWETVTLPTFTEIGVNAFGYWGGLLVDICIIITQLGGCIAYVIFISQNMSTAVGLSEFAWVLITFPFLIFLAFIRRIDKLAPTATMGNIVYLFTIGVIFYQGFRSYCCVPTEDIVWSDVSHYPLIFGTCSFALEGIALVLPVKQRMENQKDFDYVMRVALVIVTGVYLGFSTMCYLFFGADTESPIILSLPDEPLTNVVKISLSISLYFTFGLQCFPVSTFFDQVLDKHLGIDLPALRAEKQRQLTEDMHQRALAIATQQGRTVAEVEAELETPHVEENAAELVPHLSTRRFWLQNLNRFIFCIVVCTVAIIFPDFKLIVELFGSFSNALLAYILPALFWIRICASDKIYGFSFFPYDRKGVPLVHPLARDAPTYGSTAPVPATSRVSSGNVQSEREALHPTTRPKASGCSKFKWLAFPFVVAVLGSIASAIGVTDAIHDIAKHL